MFRRIVITSGPTIEPIDPVRFISNRSSGKTGYYLAKEASGRGIREIIFISGPTCFHPKKKVRFVSVETAEDMKQAMDNVVANAEVIIMAAAVSDYKIRKYYPEKIKKKYSGLKLDLIRNPDILYNIGLKKKPSQILVGFAAETEDGILHAEKKLSKKNLDLLVLNEISPKNPAFGDDFNQVLFMTRNGIKKLKRMKKSEIAVLLWDEIYEMARTRNLSSQKSP